MPISEGGPEVEIPAPAELADFVLPVLQGAVQQMGNLELRARNGHWRGSLTLIARRSWHRPGVRHWRRGADSKACLCLKSNASAPLPHHANLYPRPLSCAKPDVRPPPHAYRDANIVAQQAHAKAGGVLQASCQWQRPGPSLSRLGCYAKSRCSIEWAGVQGAVANFVETEQLVVLARVGQEASPATIASFVQVGLISNRSPRTIKPMLRSTS